jgi:hypothetical protein
MREKDILRNWLGQNLLADWNPRGKLMLQFEAQLNGWGSPMLWRTTCFIHMYWFKCSSHLKSTSTVTSQLTLDQRYHGLIKLTQNSYHHSRLLTQDFMVFLLWIMAYCLIGGKKSLFLTTLYSFSSDKSCLLLTQNSFSPFPYLIKHKIFMWRPSTPTRVIVWQLSVIRSYLVQFWECSLFFILFLLIYFLILFLLLAVLGFELRALHLLGRYSTPWTTLPALIAWVIFWVGSSVFGFFFVAVVCLFLPGASLRP